MQIGHAGGQLRLRLLGYQFPDLELGSEPLDAVSWDSSWLVVAGDVHASDGLCWSFQDPCLTTSEVIELVEWLREVAAGAVPAMTRVAAREAVRMDTYQPEGWLSFTEPNLSLAVTGRDESQLEMLIALSQECAPPPVVPRNPRRVEVIVATDPVQLTSAASALQSQLARLPKRGPQKDGQADDPSQP